MTAKFVGHSQFSFTNQEWVRMFTKFAISEALTQRLWFLTIASPRREAGADPGSRSGRVCGRVCGRETTQTETQT
jgi:hypothetical protein